LPLGSLTAAAASLNTGRPYSTLDVTVYENQNWRDLVIIDGWLKILAG
jgi:hypothetical protein